jgi:hypothetical protein
MLVCASPDEQGAVVGTGDSAAVDEGEEGESILYGNSSSDPDSEHAEMEQYATLKAHRTVNEPPATPGPRQSASILHVLDSLGIWIPLQKPRFSGYSTGQLRMAA